MPCDNCHDKGFTEQKIRKNRVLSIEYTLCTCGRGIELKELWEKYPVWVGAPYDFFFMQGA